MILLALILVPALAALVAYALPVAARSGVLLGTALVHLGLVVRVWSAPGATTASGWLADDALGRVVLTLVSVLFLAVAHYAVGYVKEEAPRGGRAFASCLLAFLAAASMVALSHHLALMWIGLETTTLAVVPLIFHRRDRRSLEAVWKYLILSSVAIALALLGVFLLSTAQAVGGAGASLLLDDMLADAGALNPLWLRAAFVFVLIGFGTKMGIAPLHSWKPDTYGEAPSLVGALMSGALTSCAFLGLARVTSICFAAGADAFVRPALIAFGVLSLVIATAFILGQRDIKRLLAYSSVEHMGLLALALGIGHTAAYGAVLHVLNNGLAKGMMFLAVGNVVLATRGTSGVRGTGGVGSTTGLVRRAPWSGFLLMVGLFAVTGSPPFGMFLSEFAIVRGAIGQHYPWLAVTILVLLAVIFAGIAAMILDMVYGAHPGSEPNTRAPAERRWLLVAPATLAVLVLLLGLYLPGPLAVALSDAAIVLAGRAP
jgi:hydrogenase-4 component F